MIQYKNKRELIDEINKTYELFVKEFDDVSNNDIHMRISSVDKTPSEMISYQIGWLYHTLGWEKDELKGIEVITPAPGIKWNELGKLYKTFYEKYENDDLKTLLEKFFSAKEEFVNWIESLSEKELFELDMRKWAYIKAGWPLWKWIHINSVAPFSSFRAKIRKWKKDKKTR